MKRAAFLFLVLAALTSCSKEVIKKDCEMAECACEELCHCSAKCACECNKP